jgi:hypothetical protein
MNLTSAMKFEADYMDTKVTMDVKRLDTEQMLDLMPMVSNLEDIAEDGTDADKLKAMNANLSVLVKAKDIIKANVSNIEGITVDDKPITGNDLVDVPQLAPLGLLVLMYMVTKSKFSADDEGNSGGVSEDQTLEDSQTETVTDTPSQTG